MKPTCQDFDHWVDPRSSHDDNQQALWHRHLEECADCRRQSEVDQLLRAGLEPKPELSFSPDFDRSLEQKLAVRRRTGQRPVGCQSGLPLSRAARALIAGYGAAAAGLSLWVLTHVDWPSWLSPDLVGGAILGLGTLLTPLLLLPRSNPFALPGLD